LRACADLAEQARARHDEHAAAAADGHAPLLDQIRTLADRARISLQPPAGAGPKIQAAALAERAGLLPSGPPRTARP
jgi:hypothetical protein